MRPPSSSTVRKKFFGSGADTGKGPQRLVGKGAACVAWCGPGRWAPPGIAPPAAPPSSAALPSPTLNDGVDMAHLVTRLARIGPTTAMVCPLPMPRSVSTTDQRVVDIDARALEPRHHDDENRSHG